MTVPSWMPALRCGLSEPAVVVDRVPRDVQRHARRDPGDARAPRAHPGSSRRDFAGTPFLGEDLEPGARVAESPGGQLDPLSSKDRLDCVGVNHGWACFRHHDDACPDHLDELDPEEVRHGTQLGDADARGRAPSGGRCRSHSRRRSTRQGHSRSRRAMWCCRSAGADRRPPGPRGDEPERHRPAAEPRPSVVTGPCVDVELDGHPPAALSVVDTEATKQWPAVADRQVSGPVVSHLHDVVAEVQRLQLGERTTPAEPVDDQHGQRGPQLVLPRRWDAASGEQRGTQDHAGSEALVLLASQPAVVVGEAVQR